MSDKYLKEIAKELKLIRREMQKDSEEANEGIQREYENAKRSNELFSRVFE